MDAKASLALTLLRDQYASLAFPAVVVPAVVTEALAAALRERVARELRPFDLAPRGRYARADAPREPVLEAAILEIVREIVGAEHVVEASRWLRFRRGDYALMRDDDAADGVEVTLDVSEAATGEADLVYARPGGAIVFAAPQQPGSLVIAQRSSAARRYERYLTHRVGDAEVFRLRLQLRGI